MLSCYHFIMVKSRPVRTLNNELLGNEQPRRGSCFFALLPGAVYRIIMLSSVYAFLKNTSAATGMWSLAQEKNALAGL